MKHEFLQVYIWSNIYGVMLMKLNTGLILSRGQEKSYTYWPQAILKICKYSNSNFLNVYHPLKFWSMLNKTICGTSFLSSANHFSPRIKLK